jgi:hypothetical protein
MGRKAGIDIIGVGPMRCQPVRLLPTLYGEVRGILSTRYPCSPSRGARCGRFRVHAMPTAFRAHVSSKFNIQ